LTTPNCAEGVTWIVLKNHAHVSTAQMTAYQALFHGTTNRPLQPLNLRTIRYKP
jgi:carbonic anhydrase